MSTESIDVVDPQGRRVTLSLVQYRQHIQPGHDEIEQVEYILSAVRNPDSIWRETRYATSQVYYRQGAHPAYPKLNLRVVVREGQVITAHLINKPRGRSHILLWTRQS
jgi:hypothetical protein